MKKPSHALKLKLLSEYIGETVRVGKRAEYPCLFIGDKLITEGSYEVSKRIDDLIRERGLQFDMDQE